MTGWDNPTRGQHDGRAGHAYSFIPRQIAEQGMTDGKVSVVQVRGIQMQRQFSLVHHRNRLGTPALSAMIELAIDLGNQRQTGLGMIS